jgi:Putative MetA-pathway of phenol degradation
MNISSSVARSTPAAILGFLALGVFTTAQACPCGCVKVCVDNLAERPVAEAGAYTLDLRYDYISQNERSNGASTDWIATHRNLVATIETQLLGRTFSINVPRVDRSLEVDDKKGKVVGLGDITITTRNNWDDYTASAGLKLPTGKDDLNILVPRRYLQPGTGSTDLLLGIRKEFGHESDLVTEFIQVQTQVAILSDSYFRPGSSLSLTAGLHYKLNESLALSLQGTLLRQYRDKNTQDTVNSDYEEDAESAGLQQIISIGISYKFNSSMNTYLFYSDPIKTSNYAPSSTGGLVNPVHASAIWSFGLIHTF